jgi:hypothetical protein
MAPAVARVPSLAFGKRFLEREETGRLPDGTFRGEREYNGSAARHAPVAQLDRAAVS